MSSINISTSMEIDGYNYEIVIGGELGNGYISWVCEEDGIEDEVVSDHTETPEQVKSIISRWAYARMDDAWENFLANYYSR